MTLARSLGALAAMLIVAPAASAEPARTAQSLAERWPSVPEGHALSLEDQIAERITLLGNSLGHHLDLLSHEVFQLQVDGRRRRAHVRLGGGDRARFAVQLDGDIQLDDANAHVRAFLDLSVRGHQLRLELPDFDVAPASLRGSYGVELRLPLFVRSF